MFLCKHVSMLHPLSPLSSLPLMHNQLARVLVSADSYRTMAVVVFIIRPSTPLSIFRQPLKAIVILWSADSTLANTLPWLDHNTCNIGYQQHPPQSSFPTAAAPQAMVLTHASKLFITHPHTTQIGRLSKYVISSMWTLQPFVIVYDVLYIHTWNYVFIYDIIHYVQLFSLDYLLLYVTIVSF